MSEWTRGVDRFFRLHPDGAGMWYHGTTEREWKAIQLEGVLWGVEVWERGGVTQSRRLTYLTPCPHIAYKFAGWGRCPAHEWKVVLSVSFDPAKYVCNFAPNCWQVRVYDPIPLSDVGVFFLKRR